MKEKMTLQKSDISRIIEMAWEDRTPFEAIETLYNLNESAVILLMRKNITRRSFKRWRERVTARKTKHQQLRPSKVLRAYCPTQYKPALTPFMTMNIVRLQK